MLRTVCKLLEYAWKCVNRYTRILVGPSRANEAGQIGSGHRHRHVQDLRGCSFRTSSLQRLLLLGLLLDEALGALVDLHVDRGRISVPLVPGDDVAVIAPQALPAGQDEPRIVGTILIRRLIADVGLDVHLR